MDTSIWHNTGGNGKASEVWVRTEGPRTAEVHVMPYRCLVTLWIGQKLFEECVPFPELSESLSYGERFLEG